MLLSLALTTLVLTTSLASLVSEHKLHLEGHAHLARSLSHNSTLTKQLKRKQSCAPKYTNKITINGPGTLPRPSGFVTKSGNALKLNGKTFKPVGEFSF